MSSSTNNNISPLLSLPAELRTHILSFLLPDLPTIECDAAWSPTTSGPPRNWPWPDGEWDAGLCRSVYQFRSDEEQCHTAVLSTCKLLHIDGTGYLYRCKTYKIHVFDHGFDFLTDAGGIRALPEIPFYEMKELVIEVEGCGIKETGCRLRENLVWVCGYLSHWKVQLKKLRIVFRDSWDPWWNTAWDETLSGEEARPPVVDDTKDNRFNAELGAWEDGFYSTFSWIISPLALLPVVDECIIDIPQEWKWSRYVGEDDTIVEMTEPCPAKQHVLDLAKWYEEGIDGTYAFEEDLRLERDRAQFLYRLKHLDGRADRECGCDGCVEHYKDVDRRAEEARRRDTGDFS
ncbi:MAG: hypothetical protein Q9207_005183 [Kuettlingeria erythrocarpa]